jgi:hypothetical protein
MGSASITEGSAQGQGAHEGRAVDAGRRGSDFVRGARVLAEASSRMIYQEASCDLHALKHEEFESKSNLNLSQI